MLSVVLILHENACILNLFLLLLQNELRTAYIVFLIQAMLILYLLYSLIQFFCSAFRAFSIKMLTQRMRTVKQIYSKPPIQAQGISAFTCIQPSLQLLAILTQAVAVVLDTYLLVTFCFPFASCLYGRVKQLAGCTQQV